MRRYKDDDLGGRIMNYVVSGNVDMIKGLLELKFLNPQYDTFNYTGSTNHHNAGDLYLLLELLAAQYETIPNYKDMIDLLLRHGNHVDDHADAITPLELALIHKNFPVAAYLMSKGGTYNIEEIADFSKAVGVDVVAEMNVEYTKLTG